MTTPCLPTRALAVLALLSACDQDSGIKVTNTAPTASIDSHSNGASVPEQEVVTLSGTVGDANHGTSDLDVTWRADGEVLCQGAPAADGTTTCDAEFLPGTVEVRLTVADPSGATAEDTVSLEVVQGDAPVVDLQTPDGSIRYYAGTPIDVLVAVSDADDDLSSLVLSWESTADGSLPLTAGLDTDGTARGSVTLSAGEHDLIVTATDPAGHTGSDRTTITVVGENVGPDCEITVPATMTAAESDGTIVFEGVVSDDQQSPGQLDIVWSSDKEGELGTSVADSSGDVSFATSLLVIDTHTVTMTVTDELGEICTDSVLIPVSSRPDATIDTPSDGDNVAQGADLTFSGVVSDDEDPEVDLTVTWTSDVDGLLSTASPDSGGLTTFQTDGLTTGSHIVTLEVTDSVGLTARDIVRFTIDGLPTAPGVDITPDPASTSDDLTVAVTTAAVDPEGATLSYAYTWSKNGVVQSAYTTDTVPASATGAGQTWSVAVTAYDGTGFGPAGTDSVVISNTAPVISSVALTPSTPDTNDELSVSVISTDADGDGVSYTYTWTVDGVSTGTTGSTLDGSYFDKGDVVEVTVTPTDGTDTGAAATASVVVVNAAPSMDTVTLSPSTPSTSDTLSVAATSSDPDGDSVTYTYAWTVDGVSTGTSSSTLDSSYFDKGDVVQVSVTPDDGTDTGSAMSASVTIGNTAPEVTGITFTPSAPLTNDILTPVVSWADADGDSVSYSFTWTVNGVSTGTTGSTLNGATYFDKGDVVQVTVTANDGTDSSAPLSASVTIGNSPPTLASVSLSPGTAYTNDTLTASAGAATDPDGDPVTLSYAWTVDGSSTGTSASTLSGITYFERDDLVVVTVTPTDGTDTGTAVSDSITISNTPPTDPTVAIAPSAPMEGIDDLICGITAASTDADGDSINYTFYWEVDGYEYPDADTASTYLGPFTTTYTDDSVPSSDIVEGEIWTCYAVADDGTNSSGEAEDEVTITASTTCGDGVLDSGEEYDPAPGPFSSSPVDYGTCRWDFSGVQQLYCNGSCTWSGASGCQQAEADILCKLITDNPASTATSWTATTALAQPGFSCAPLNYGTVINVSGRGLPSFGFNIRYQDSSILANHGAGDVVAYPVCTDP